MGDAVLLPAFRSWGLWRRARGVLVLLMAGLAIAAPFFAGALALTVIGLLLIACGALEMLETFWAGGETGRRSAYLSGALSMAAGALLLGEPQIVLGGLSLLVGGSFLLDGLGKMVAAWRSVRADQTWQWRAATGITDLLLGGVLVTGWPISGLIVVGVIVGLHMLAAGWAMLLNREVPERAYHPDEYPDRHLGLPARPEFAELDAVFAAEDRTRQAIDAYWCWMFILVFFAIHLGRMRVEWNLVGMISPLVAVVGDIGMALVIAFGLILPLHLLWRRSTRPLERREWQRRLDLVDRGQRLGWRGWVSGHWLRGRMRLSRRLAQVVSSPAAALRWGLQVGLPVTAILIAINPMWGFSWYFNSENWTSEVWNRWAAARTDTWREHMIGAVEKEYPQQTQEQLFAVSPGRLGDDFSFLVLGDTGEGDASQHSLRDQYLFLGQRPDVKFMVISSDVIYPAGAMSDYEAKFYLPFKGFTKPIYAIPGNHDWFDALEGFNANFLEANAARAAMRVRINADGRLTTTTEGRIDRYIAEAARLRREFGVSTGWQHGPFFEVQT
jgi:uncharacterized membrane protein HdeD (DUF308 family)